MMKFIHSIKNSSGSVMVQVMVAGALVIGGAAYIMSTQRSQNKLQSGIANKFSQSAVQKEITEILSNGEICYNTLKKQDVLEEGDQFDGIYNKENQKVYGVGSELYNNKISEIKLEDYTPSAGSKYQLANLSVMVEVKEPQAKSYGGKSRRYKIPVFLITEDNVVDTCLSDGAGTVILALKKACEDLQGTFNEVSARCEKFHSEDGTFLKYLKENLCSTTGAACVHPYLNRACAGKDIRGEDHGNWVIKGFDANGIMECACIPVKCPEPSMYCLGRNLGTNWCDQVCPVGSKIDGACGSSTAGGGGGGTTGSGPSGGGTSTGGSASGTRGGSGCFIAGTQISLKDGTTKSIENMMVGDQVQTFDEVTQSVVIRPVVKVFFHEKKLQELYEFHLSDGTKVTSNDIHPFYLTDETKYYQAAEVYRRWERGEMIRLLTKEQKVVTVWQLKRTYKEVEVFNLHVNGAYDTERAESPYNHNYFANGVLVHNLKCSEDVGGHGRCDGM